MGVAGLGQVLYFERRRPPAERCRQAPRALVAAADRLAAAGEGAVARYALAEWRAGRLGASEAEEFLLTYAAVARLPCREPALRTPAGPGPGSH